MSSSSLPPRLTRRVAHPLWRMVYPEMPGWFQAHPPRPMTMTEQWREGAGVHTRWTKLHGAISHPTSPQGADNGSSSKGPYLCLVSSIICSMCPSLSLLLQALLDKPHTQEACPRLYCSGTCSQTDGVKPP